MVTLAHDVCNVYGASSLYIKTCWQILYSVFPTGGTEESPHQPKRWSFTSSPPNFYFLSPKVNSTQYKNKNIFSGSHCSCAISALISQIMLILILIDVQYSQNAVFSFEKFSNRQNYSSSCSHHLIKKIPPAVFTTFWHKAGFPIVGGYMWRSSFTSIFRQHFKPPMLSPCIDLSLPIKVWRATLSQWGRRAQPPPMFSTPVGNPTKSGKLLKF